MTHAIQWCYNYFVNALNSTWNLPSNVFNLVFHGNNNNISCVHFIVRPVYSIQADTAFCKT